jgi:BirA family biotin operon repressor/biotin-[acetyl-CoA-carboxylase] ligase
MTPSWKPWERTSGRFVTVRVVDETGSTNADLVERARNGLPAGDVLIARHQTSGRGRQGRSWFDRPDSSLLMSWSIDIDATLAPLVPLAAGVAVTRAMEGVAGDGVIALKWPNDVLAPGHDERKVAGILAEAVPARAPSDVSGGPLLRVVVGMGVNVDLDGGVVPDEVAARAVDLVTLAGGPIDRAALVDALLDACDDAIDLLEQSTTGLIEDYRRRCLTIGRSVRFETATGQLDGVVQTVGLDGSLVLEQADGTIRHLTAGDAHHVA